MLFHVLTSRLRGGGMIILDIGQGKHQKREVLTSARARPKDRKVLPLDVKLCHRILAGE
jgi:hypothetical protein